MSALPSYSSFRVTCTIIYTDVTILAPLPVEESDAESGAEDVSTTKAELAINNDEPADATMKDKEEVEEEDDDDDPETSVLGSGGILHLTDNGSVSLLKLLRTTAQTSKMWVIVHFLIVASRLLIWRPS